MPAHQLVRFLGVGGDWAAVAVGDDRDLSLGSQPVGHALDLIIDGGGITGQPSSIISLIDDTPEILREGSGDVNIFRG